MVRVKRDHHWVWPDRYYIWTYFPEKFRRSVNQVTEKKLYAKHYTCIPYFTRRHAKHVACFYHGVKALHSIHIISGKKLISQGITTFNKANGQKKYKYECFIRKRDGSWYPAHLRQWAYPPEFHCDSHRRRRYIVTMNQAFGNGGKIGRKRFNRKYAEYNYSHSYRRISRAFFNMKVVVARRVCWNELELEKIKTNMEQLTIKKVDSIYPFTIYKCFRQGRIAINKQEAITINSMDEFNTLLDEVKQYNNDLGNQLKGRYIVINKNKV